MDQAEPTRTESEVGSEEEIELQVAEFDPQRSLADQIWFPSRVRIFLDQSGPNRKFHLKICRDNSLFTRHASRTFKAQYIENAELMTEQFSQRRT